MLLLEGYIKRVYIDRASAARGGPPWAIRVTNGRGRTVTFLAFSWQLRPSPGLMRGCGSRAEPLTPTGPALWVETTMALEIVCATDEAQIPRLAQSS